MKETSKTIEHSSSPESNKETNKPEIRFHQAFRNFYTAAEETWNRTAATLSERINQDPKTKQKLNNAAETRRKFLSRALAISIIGSGIACSTEKSHNSTEPKEIYPDTKSPMDYKVTKRLSPEGEEFWEHEDQITTSIIETLAGRRPLPESQKETILYDLRDTLEQITRERLELSKTYENDEYSGESTLVYDISRENSGRYRYRFQEKNFNRDLYKALWQIMAKFGNPKVRWKNKTQGSGWDDMFRSEYDPETNTIYLSIIHNINEFEIDIDTKHLVAELTHVGEFRERPEETKQAFEEAHRRILKKVQRRGISYHDAQLEEYKTPGSAEQTAHAREKMISDAIRELSEEPRKSMLKGINTKVY